MQYLRMDGRKTGVALAATLCLFTPAQKPVSHWLAQHVGHGEQKPGEQNPAEQPAPPTASTEAKTDSATSETATPTERAAALGHDLSGVAAALTAYHAGNLAAGDAALTTSDPLTRAALEWTALRTRPAEAGIDRIATFLRAHADWPGANSLRKYAEEMAASDSARAERVAAYFSEFPPLSVTGEIAYAAFSKDDPAQRDEALRLAREIWRESDLSPLQEKRLLKNFGSSLTAADHIYRADRLMLKEATAPAARVAALAGKDAQALVKAQAALAGGASWKKAAMLVPAALRDDPALLLLRIQSERHADHIDEAARLMLDAPRDPAKLVGPDEWWTERRLVARKLLDANDFSRAYRICAEHAAVSPEARIEAEFHAGWIALRFLNDPALPSPHFENMATLAKTPHSASRAAYWRGRTAEAKGEEARSFYERAAAESETFYGQLARAKLGAETAALRAPPVAAEGDARHESVRAVELLFALGETDAARQLALDGAQALRDPAQMAALSRVIERDSDARTALLAGKAALHRGVAIDTLAYPTNGVPRFVALANSASLPLVMSIARQESAFDTSAHSGAGAKGLMQMISSTARTAASHAGVAYDEARLQSDPAFNAQLGAFHLGELLGEYRGSYVLTFAAYNAGGGNVKKWIEAYGDPRSEKVDPIDWIERIPFTETRNYVQRVAENLHVYRARLGDSAPSLFKADLRQKVAATEPLAAD